MEYYNCICVEGFYFSAHTIAPRKKKAGKKKQFHFLFLWALENKIKAIHTAEQRGKLYICVSITPWLIRKPPDFL